MGNPQNISADGLSEALDAADSYLRTKLQPFDDKDGGTVKYHNVSRGGSVPLPTDLATVTAARLFRYSDSPAAVLRRDVDFYLDGGRLVLTPKSNAVEWFSRLEVDWGSPGSVPAAVRDGVALTAAALFAQFPRLFQGTRSERIGDYSYTLSDKEVEDVVPLKALKLLQPFMKRRRGVFVT